MKGRSNYFEYFSTAERIQTFQDHGQQQQQHTGWTCWNSCRWEWQTGRSGDFLWHHSSGVAPHSIHSIHTGFCITSKLDSPFRQEGKHLPAAFFLVDGAFWAAWCLTSQSGLTDVLMVAVRWTGTVLHLQDDDPKNVQNTGRTVTLRGSNSLKISIKQITNMQKKAKMF